MSSKCFAPKFWRYVIVGSTPVKVPVGPELNWWRSWRAVGEGNHTQTCIQGVLWLTKLELAKPMHIATDTIVPDKTGTHALSLNREVS